jgi:hypothetical protein
MSNNILAADMEERILKIDQEVNLLQEIYAHEESKIDMEINSFNLEIEKAIAISTLSFYVVNIYTKFEDVFSMVANNIDQYAHKGEHWHAQLLNSMRIAGDRPAYISQNLYEVLESLRGFRNIGRNNYASKILPMEIPDKVEKTFIAIEMLKEQYKDFAKFHFNHDCKTLIPSIYVNKGNFYGPVCDIGNNFVSQKHSELSDNIVKHKFKNLSRIPELNEDIEVTYKNGHANVSDKKIENQINGQG